MVGGRGSGVADLLRCASGLAGVATGWCTAVTSRAGRVANGAGGALEAFGAALRATVAVCSAHVGRPTAAGIALRNTRRARTHALARLGVRVADADAGRVAVRVRSARASRRKARAAERGSGRQALEAGPAVRAICLAAASRARRRRHARTHAGARSSPAVAATGVTARAAPARFACRAGAGRSARCSPGTGAARSSLAMVQRAVSVGGRGSRARAGGELQRDQDRCARLGRKA